jgi:hypothetical protein
MALRQRQIQGIFARSGNRELDTPVVNFDKSSRSQDDRRMALDPNKFTRKTGEALQAAQSLARERNHTQVTPEHLLGALLGQPESVVLPVLERLGVAPKALVDRVDDAIGALPQVYGQTTQTAQLSPDAYQVLEDGTTYSYLVNDHWRPGLAYPALNLGLEYTF